jgi:hypothetical protein
LEVTGAGPAELVEIRQKLWAELHANGGDKSDTDFVYDGPAKLAQALTGFRHDQEMPGMEGKVLRRWSAQVSSIDCSDGRNGSDEKAPSYSRARRLFCSGAACRASVGQAAR